MSKRASVATMIVAIAIFLGTIIFVPLQTRIVASAAEEMTGGPLLAMGHIGSVQIGSTGQADWLQSGIWVLRVLPSSAQPGNPQAQFIARFEMVKPDGTAMHVHKIYGFKATEMTQEGNSTDVIKGTATVTLKDGPVADVPLTIKVFNSAVVGFWIGPDKVDGHFGSGPVYGLLSTNSKAVMQDMHSMMQGMIGQGGGQNSTTGSTPQSNTIKMSAKEVDEVYRWSNETTINPTLKLVANANNVIQIANPTDTKHELVIESNDTELASSGDIAPDSSGQLMFKPSMAGTFEYHCEYHPDTMKGTIEVTNQ
jgi:plastocyanin